MFLQISLLSKIPFNCSFVFSLLPKSIKNVTLYNSLLCERKWKQLETD